MMQNVMSILFQQVLDAITEHFGSSRIDESAQSLGVQAEDGLTSRFQDGLSPSLGTSQLFFRSHSLLYLTPQSLHHHFGTLPRSSRRLAKSHYRQADCEIGGIANLVHHIGHHQR